MKRIESNKYYDAVRKYFVDHKDPSRVYAFLLNTLWTDNGQISINCLRKCFTSVSICLIRQMTVYASTPEQSVFSLCIQTLKDKAEN